MTIRDDALRLAKESGITPAYLGAMFNSQWSLQQIEAIVRLAKIEAYKQAAKVCEIPEQQYVLPTCTNNESQHYFRPKTSQECATAIHKMIDEMNTINNEQR